MNLKAECTECIVYTNSREGSAKGNLAVAEVRTGDSKVLLLMSKTDSGATWRPPMLTLQQNGHASPMPVLSGELLEQAKYLAGVAVEKIKAKFGKTAYGTTYRIAKGVCETIENPK